MSEERVSWITELVRERRTRKVIAKNGAIALPQSDVARCNQIVQQAIATAGFAPFHYDRKTDGVAEPWRFHVIWHEQCRLLGAKLREWFPEMRPSNKLPGMLNACGALVIVNWLPQFDADEADEQKKVQINEEHLAATSAAIQNLLLVLTAHELGNYWSSGGFFRSAEMFLRLGIDKREKLLGAIFVDYGAPESAVDVISGKQHERRCDSSKCTRVVNDVDVG